MNLEQSIITDIQSIIKSARENAVRAVDHERVTMYWHIGKRIFDEEQHGADRAEYGTQLIKYLSEQLQPQFGRGFSARNLNLFRQFYRGFPIVQTLSAQLSWSHYSLLLTIPEAEKREFYKIETIKNNWSFRQVERQIGSQLYERLLLSTDKEKVLSVARNEQQPDQPKDIIKDPMVLEFLGLKPEATYFEKDLESALITHLQEFMLELGNVFHLLPGKNASIWMGTTFLSTWYSTTGCCNVLLSLN
jgi:predicted nuclease of restriction endonuclease-like (RecB) superfamily